MENDLWKDLQPFSTRNWHGCRTNIAGMAIVLCDLEGKTRKQAASQAGLAEGTLASRLARGRAMLAKRLARRGLALTGGSLAALMAQHASAASVPTTLISATIKAATIFAAGNAAAGGIVSAKVVALTEGVLKTMLLSKLKIATAMVASAVVLFGAAGTWATSRGSQVGTGTVQKKAKDVNWKEVEDKVQPIVRKQSQDAHPDMPHMKTPECIKCHGPGNQDQQLRSDFSGGSDHEKVQRLEQEIQKLREENELLRLEAWILLKEIQRQNGQKKDGK